MKLEWWRKIWTSAWARGALVVLWTVAVYLPVLHGGFIWDDDQHLTENPCIVGPLGFKEIWTSSHAFYYPLVLTSFWVLHKFVGLNPLPYHLLNVLLHAGSALVLCRVLQQLRVRGAWLAAALWALHPVMVQSVAWITELKNTQSCWFYLLSILFFLKADESNSRGSGATSKTRWRWRLGLSLLFFAMAITSKPSTVMLPAVLTLCLWWRRGRLGWRDLAVLAPFFLISAGASSWTIWEQKFHSGAIGEEWGQTPLERLAIAGRDVWFYLGKLIWPHPLIFIYPRWKIDATQLSTFVAPLAAIAGLFCLWWKRNSRLRPFFFAGAYFLVSLLPVLGFFDVYFFRYAFVSDHFQYLASIGPIALAGAGVATAFDVIKRRNRFLEPVFCGLLLSTLGLLSWWQSATYSDAETLYRTTIERNRDCWMAHNNLGDELLQKGRVDEAIAHCQRSLEIEPGHAEAHCNLGNAWLQKGDVAKAIGCYEKALEIKPNYAEAHCNLGTVLLQKGQMDEAISHFQKALNIKSDYAKAYNNLGLALMKKGRVDEAIAHYQRALEIKPGSAEVLNNLGTAFLRGGQTDQAFAHFRKAMEIQPSNEAIPNNLAWLLATSPDASQRNGIKAVEFAQQTIELTGENDPSSLDTLAAAFAESGDYERALEAATHALERAKSANDKDLAAQIEQRLELYRHQQPYRQPVK